MRRRWPYYENARITPAMYGVEDEFRQNGKVDTWAMAREVVRLRRIVFGGIMVGMVAGVALVVMALRLWART